MNIEYEVKILLRGDGTPNMKADRIRKITNFSEEDIIAAIMLGGRTTSDIYQNLLNLNAKHIKEK